jgi:hypothetical protein
VTDHDPIEPDPLVETALRLLPVPDHEPDFWARVEEALDAAPPKRSATAEKRPAASGGPGAAGKGALTAAAAAAVSAGRPRTAALPALELVPGPVPGVVPAAMRRPSNVVLSAIAVVAAIAVLVAGATLVRSRTDDGLSDEAASTEPAGAPSAAPEGLVAPSDEPAAAIVVDWINAVAAGEMEEAWSLLGPRSQTDWGSFDAFASEATGLAEGYGAWRVSAPEILVTPLGEDGDEGLVVVTLVGAVPQEGTTRVRADAFPVRLVGERGVLELYDSAGVMEIVVPDDVGADGALPVLDPSEEIVLVVPGGVVPVLRLGDGPVVVCGEAPGTQLTPLEGTPGQRCGYSPPGGLPAGDQVLLAAFTSPDGSSVTAHGAPFTVR